ncbi:hypothetical protein SISSUDRAFT_1111740 [Sistotremastrum suecicum HHB10207 ss-3]|uniref:Ketoreductase (KR) domain-containing protein n=1 Tax=Sistotremastrum suecicum HHB10207 ss-3 TaxID=1314776 RepID=A0A166ISL5_9AGAM|nr:hypothetical protein SISSUDRAFT_1111740 [Sistotremastrum suecicum HHB10207 ss-3]
MKYLVLGGSRNIGYLTSIRLLEAGNTVTFLLRRKSAFDDDATIQKYIKTQNVRLVQGDATVRDDVARAWQVAAEGDDNSIDGVIVTVGAAPAGGQAKLSLRKGIVLNPPNLVANCVFNVLATWPHSPGSSPKLIVVTSNGLTKETHSALPWILKPLYGWFLAGPHEDKLGAERLIYHIAGRDWKEKEPNSEILPSGWKDQLPSGSWLPDAVIVRPAMSTNGECRAESNPKKSYRTSFGTLPKAWTVSRKDISHFIVARTLAEWDSWKGKAVVVSY